MSQPRYMTKKQIHRIMYRLNSDIFKKQGAEFLDESILRIKHYIDSHTHTAFLLRQGNFCYEDIVSVSVDLKRREMVIKLDNGNTDRHFDVVNIVNNDNITICCIYYQYEQWNPDWGRIVVNLDF